MRYKTQKWFNYFLILCSLAILIGGIKYQNTQIIFYSILCLILAELNSIHTRLSKIDTKIDIVHETKWRR